MHLQDEFSHVLSPGMPQQFMERDCFLSELGSVGVAGLPSEYLSGRNGQGI